MACPHCGETELVKHGHDGSSAQVHRSRHCRGTCTALSATPFSGYRFPPDVIAVAVRLYLRYRLSLADVVELLAERHLHLDQSTVHDWVQRFVPLYQEQARAHRRRVGSAWAVDETYIKVAGRPRYLWRAVDEHGKVVDVCYSKRRDAVAAEALFRSALRETDVAPQRVTTNEAAAYPPALGAVLPEAEQQAIERDHQHLKGRIRCMGSFKSAAGAAVFGRAHAFTRNLHDGFYRLGLVPGGPRLPQRPRLALAWDELTTQLLAA